MTNRTNPVAALQKQASVALGDVRQALGELAAILRPDRLVEEELPPPVRRLVQGLAGIAELAVGPIVTLVDSQHTFVESQRALADQMTAWADLQHQLADRMAAWAELQRQVAAALEMSLAPVSGAAHLTTRLLQEAAGTRPGVRQRRAKAAAPRAASATASRAAAGKGSRAGSAKGSRTAAVKAPRAAAATKSSRPRSTR